MYPRFRRDLSSTLALAVSDAKLTASDQAALSLSIPLSNALLALISFSFILLISACQPAPKSDRAINQDESATLYLYNWSEYMPTHVLENFEKETGIEVVYDTYESNEQMYEQYTQANLDHPYDLMVPSSYYVEKMRREGLLLPIDKDKLTNFAQLSPSFIDMHVDPDNQYSIPYLWGTTGIGINTDTVAVEAITGWDDLWQEEFRGRVMLTNDMREVFGMTLMTLGYSSNTQDPEEIKAAYEKLLTLLPAVKIFESESARAPYMSGVTDVGMIWSGEAIMANAEGMDNLHYQYPREGAILWTDNFVIPKGAQNIEAAHLFIDFILRAENAQIVSRQLGYATPNLGARLFMPQQTKDNVNIYPSPAILDKAQLQRDVRDEALVVYQYYWDKLKARSKQLGIAESESTAE